MENDIHLSKNKSSNITGKVIAIGSILLLAFFILYNFISYQKNNEQNKEKVNYNQTEITQETNSITPEELELYIRKNKIVERILLSNPEVIINALKIYDQKKQNELKNVNPQVLTEALQTKDAIVIGAENPFLTIVKFNDFNCEFCRRSSQELLKIMESRNDIRLIIRDTPIITKESKDLAKINQALLLQSNQYAYEYYKAIEKLSQSIDLEEGLKIAEEIGADMEKLKKDIASSEIENKIENALILSQKVPVTGTPTFIIGQKRYEGYMDYDTLNQIINQELNP